jgi:PAS domain-containing protein
MKIVKPDFFEKLWGESLVSVKTVTEVAREPILILDERLCVIVGNKAFYEMFHIKPKEVEGKLIYELDNGQWDIPELRKSLEDILPRKTFFKGFVLASEFQLIGKKTLLLSARQIYFDKKTSSKSFPGVILLAIEDITEMMDVAEMLGGV